jgi:hypothetical protein
MEELWIQIQPYLLWGFVLLCVVPALLTLAAVYFAIRRINRALVVDLPRLKQEFEAMRARNPRATDEQLLRKVIQQQAFRSGIVGALTSIGGFITLPIALPVDIFWSIRIQAQMVEFISAASGVTDISPYEQRIRQYLITTGGVRAAQSGTRAVLNFAVRVMGKSFSKLIPVVGAVIGFGVNYAITQAIGYAALNWYTKRSAQLEADTRPPLP